MKDMENHIHVENGYDEGSYTYYPIVIIGAGETGIAMGCRLKEVLGFDQFRIFDRQAGLGGVSNAKRVLHMSVVLTDRKGTWWINRYPGVACGTSLISVVVKST